MVLAPRMMTIVPSLAGGVTTFTVTCSPRVANTQKAVLIVGDREIPAEPLVDPLNATLAFRSGGFVSADVFWVRLRVDGIESILVDRSVTPPAFDATQEVTIP